MIFNRKKNIGFHTKQGGEFSWPSFSSFWHLPWVCWSVKSNLQSNPGCYFQTMSGIRLLRTVTLHLQRCWLWLAVGDSGGDLVMFLIITSSWRFCRLRFIISVAPAKIMRSNKRPATSEKRRNTFWKYFHLPSQGVGIGVLINSHVSSNHSVLGTEQCWWSLPPALPPPLCWKSKTGICGFDCYNLNWITGLHYHLVRPSSGCWELTKLVMTSMINHKQWVGLSTDSCTTPSVLIWLSLSVKNWNPDLRQSDIVVFNKWRLAWPGTMVW